MTRKYPFSCYSFIKREHGTWVSLGLIRDDTVGDVLPYDYTIPNSIEFDQDRAEILAVMSLARTAPLVLPAEGIDRIKVRWTVSSEAIKEALLANDDAVELFEKASHYWEVCLMSDEQLEAFNKEIESGSELEAEEE